MKPNELNFNVPGRFEEHFCTFITWPCKGDKEIDIFRKEINSPYICKAHWHISNCNGHKSKKKWI